MKTALRIIKVVLVLVIIVALSCVVYTVVRNNQTTDEYETTIRQYTSQSAETAAASKDSADNDGEDVDVKDVDSEDDATAFIIGADFDALTAVNGDVAAWLAIPDTAINYPVVQGGNNTTYLYSGWDGVRRSGGAAFIDAREDVATADNLIIYGHAMSTKSSIMFSELLGYKDKAYYEEHPSIYLSFADDPINMTQISSYGDIQPAGQYEFQIIAVVQADTGNEEEIAEYYWYDRYDISVNGYVSMIQEASLYDIEFTGTPYKFVTLSTCSRPGSGSNVKLLIIGAISEESLIPSETEVTENVG